MLRTPRSTLRSAGCSSLPALILCGAAALLSACSADITRFDSPFYGMSGSEGPGNAYPTPPDTVRRNAGAPVFRDEPPAYVPSVSEPQGRGGVVVSALPSAEPPREYVRETPAAPLRYEAPAPVRATPAPLPKGELIEVRQGDTIYGIAKRHQVSISELMRVNDLQNPNIKPGQRLHLPVTASARVKVKTVHARETGGAANAGGFGGASQSWNATHTVKPGESLYTIARTRGTTVEELVRVNGIADARKVRPETVLRVPGEGDRAGEAQQYAASPAAPLRAPAARQPIEDAPISVAQGAARARVINRQVAAADPRESVPDVAPLAGVEGSPARETGAGKRATAGAKFRWPVQGPVLAGFGPQANGGHNDGVNLAVPLGTEVVAAEAGVVAYANNELQGYGNLVLVRHDNGWVTAYAHNDRLLVQRGDRVKRGQPIARAGRTGTVDQPQVHFEVRQGSRPVDPIPHMERM